MHSVEIIRGLILWNHMTCLWLFAVFENHLRVKYRPNMLSLCETSNSLLFKNRAASLVLLTVTSVLFLQATGNALCYQPFLITIKYESENEYQSWQSTSLLGGRRALSENSVCSFCSPIALRGIKLIGSIIPGSLLKVWRKSFFSYCIHARSRDIS